MTDLISYADVTDFYPDADATKSGKLIKAISARIQRKLALEYTEAMDEMVRSCGGEYLTLPRYPLFSVTSIKQDGIELGDWERYPNGDKWGHLRRKNNISWPFGTKEVSPFVPYSATAPVWVHVTYAAGYALPGMDPAPPEGVPTLPDDVVMELVDWVGNRLSGRSAEISNAGRIVQKQQIGAMSVQYAQTSKTRTVQEMEEAFVDYIVGQLSRPGIIC